ncbi:MAG: 50S ribosomal protein L28 [Dehalococcoidia bacterium]|nr:50S ribosomal protein L28 [Dehalococcoidia bacterium]
MECDICGKRPRFGYNVSHSKRHTKRRWMPNVHKATVTLGGVEKRMKVCTRCLRTQAKATR